MNNKKSSPSANVHNSYEALMSKTPKPTNNKKMVIHKPDRAGPTMDQTLVDRLLLLFDDISVQKYRVQSGGKDAPTDSTASLVENFFSQKLSRNQRAKLEPILKQVINTVIFQEGVAAQFLHAFLAINTPSEKDDKLAENKFAFINDLLIQILAFEATAFRQWKQYYIANMVQSNNLMLYIADNWSLSEDKIVIGPTTIPTEQCEAFRKNLLGFLKEIDDINVAFQEGKTTTVSGQTKSLKKSGLTLEVVEVARATCHKLERAIHGSREEEITDEEQGTKSNKFRIFLSILMILFIYFIWVNDVQFSDVKEFIQVGKNLVDQKVLEYGSKFGMNK